ncbi:MAG: CPBP family intramembrane metalloprotease [Leptolyngbyaceae cyanobacterium RU_5_1]|nr:CPBP family intramembrane metalloprotease [Leptolyngbyaceae cyanobacterium RU_5_1]
MEKVAMRPMGLRESLVFFGIPTLLLYVATQIGVPTLSRVTGLPLIVSWFVCSGTLVFLPLFFAAFVFYWLEGNPWQVPAILARFRLSPLSWHPFGWIGLGVIGVGGLTYGMIAIAQALIPNFSPQPAFMSMPPLTGHDRWILAAWVPLFFFNIVGEGLFWRGYIFPRQELAFGQSTWFLHGCCWWMFHLPFGGALLVTLIPIIFITSFVVQKTKNTWSDIIIHTLINGSGFLLVAFGIVE